MLESQESVTDLYPANAEAVIMENYPDLLTQVPAVVLRYDMLNSDGKLSLSVDGAITVYQEYQREVEAFLQARQRVTEPEVADSLEFALRIFNAYNFTGELCPAEEEFYAPILSRFAMLKPMENRFVQRLLVADGEAPSMCVRYGSILLCALAIAESRAADGTPIVPDTSLWKLRTHFRHQLALERRSFTIFNAVAKSVDAILALPEEEQTPQMLVEVGHAKSYYHRREEAADCFRKAAKVSGLVMSEEAMLGVRTRWQQHQLTQMVLHARSTNPPTLSELDAEKPYAVPKTIMGEEEGHDLLDRPRETATGPASPLEPLNYVDKAIILALCMDIRNTNPHHGLTQRHMLTYIERVVADPAPSPYIVRSQTLLIRARLESRRNRVQERSFLQMTELVDQFRSMHHPTPHALPRTNSAHCFLVAYPPIWALKSELAEFCVEENLMKTALDIFEQTFNWEKIIQCCKALDKRKRAESLARDLLAEDPENPMLWVALGEVTRIDDYLWKAWELSGHKMAAPMRALAVLALEREHYDKVVEYFDEAVKINPVFGGDWFSLGFASMKLSDFNRSGAAFTRVCQMDPNNAYAWNNLSSVLLRQGKMRPAFNAMGQALRNNRRNWRMWQNYFSIGCELDEVTESTTALNAALQIGKRSVELDGVSLAKFANMVIRYLKGELPVHSSLAGYDDVDVGNGGGGNMGMSYSEGDEEDSTGLENVMPLCSEIELPETFYSNSTAKQETEAKALTEKAIRTRFRRRIRDTLTHIMNVFVTCPDVYDMAATILEYLDGPLSSFELRLKEMRCCKQKDQWERAAEPFERTVLGLQRLSADAIAAYDCFARGDYVGLLGSKERDAPPVATCAGQPKGVTENNPVNGEVSLAAQEEVTGTEEAAPRQVSESEVSALQQYVISSLKVAINNIDTVLQASEEHMEETPAYRNAVALRGKTQRVLREAMESSCC